MSPRLLLLPFSLIYGAIVFFRNKLFDLGFKKETIFDVPIISVGNITVGGTGKTPHIEYILSLLQNLKHVAVLSRGYKRRTKGYVLATANSTPEIIGDEPFQIFRKNPNALVAVCEKRVDGIKQLLKQDPKLNAILLDDAFQHRYVKPGLSILLIDFNRPVFSDFLLPAGSLREGMNGVKRADIIIVTKVTKEIDEQETMRWLKRIKLEEHQTLFFSSYVYGAIQSVFSSVSALLSLEDLVKSHYKVLLVTGIAQPTPFINYIAEFGIEIETIQFPDHHNFSLSDLNKIQIKFDAIQGKKKAILTTEKDAVRFKHNEQYPEYLKDKTYYLPIKVEILGGKGQELENKLLKYVKQD